MAPAFKISDAPQIDRKGLCETKENGGDLRSEQMINTRVCVCVCREGTAVFNLIVTPAD